MTTENPVPSALARPDQVATVAMSEIGSIIKFAVETKADVASISELVTLKNQQDDRAAKAEFIRAMFGFRSEVPKIVKANQGQHEPKVIVTRNGRKTKGLYAGLDEIVSIIDPVCNRHGLIYKFDRETYEGKEYEVCEVSHIGGHSERTRYPVGVDGGPGRTATQAVGSGDSYARRYALTAAFAITCFDPIDDDGADQRRDDQPTGPVEKITDAQAANLGAMLDEACGPTTPKAEKDAVCRWMKVAYLSDIPAFEFTRVRNAIESKRAKGWKA